MSTPWEQDIVQEAPKGNPWAADLVSEGGPSSMPSYADLTADQRKNVDRRVSRMHSDNRSNGMLAEFNPDAARKVAIRRAQQAGWKNQKKSSRGMAMLSNFGNTATFGVGDELAAGISAAAIAPFSDKSIGEIYKDKKGIARETRRVGRRDHWLSSAAGDVLGFGAAGAQAYKMAGQGLGKLGAATGATALFGKTRGTAYAARLASEVGKFGAGSAAYGFGPGGTNKATDEGRGTTFGDRAGSAMEYGTHPMNLLPVPLSFINRGTIGIKSAMGGSRPMTMTPNKYQAQAAQEFGRAASDPASVILETTRQKTGIPKSSIDGLHRILRQSGYSSDDIAAGLTAIDDRGHTSAVTGDRIGIFATELQKAFPHAAQNIKDVTQQLATASPKQGQTALTLTGAIDDQFASQRQHLDDTTRKALGTDTVVDDLKQIATERAAIGEARDGIIKFANTDARGRGVKRQMEQRIDEFSDDPEIMSAMRTAARELGYYGKGEVRAAINDGNAPILIQKFGEIAGKKARANPGKHPILERARDEFETLFDEASRYGRTKHGGFAAKDTGAVGPYKRKQAGFREGYSQEDAINLARGKFAQAQDPVKAQAFVEWVQTLPAQEQKLVKDVIRQDVERMARGGTITQDGAYLTGLKKEGVSDVLIKLFGKDGERISNAVRQLDDEAAALKDIDPRKGLQQRVVKKESKGYKDALDLYSTGVGGMLSRAGHKIPAIGGYGVDVPLMMTGNLPYATLAKQGAKMLRPRTKTREGLADLLAMTPGQQVRPRAAGPGGTPAPASSAPPAAEPPPPQTPSLLPQIGYAEPKGPGINPVSAALRGTQKALAKPSDPRRFSEMLDGPAPERTKPGVSYFEQLPDKRRVAERLGEIGAADTPAARRLQTYMKRSGERVRSVDETRQIAQAARKELDEAELAAAQAGDEYAALLNELQGPNPPPILRVTLDEARQRARQTAQRVSELRAAMPESVDPIPPTELDALARLRAATTAANQPVPARQYQSPEWASKRPRMARAHKALFDNVAQYHEVRRSPWGQRTDDEFVELMLNPDRADDALTIARGQPQWDSFKRTGVALPIAAGSGIAGATIMGGRQVMQSAKDNQPLGPPSKQRIFEVQDTLRTLGYNVDVDGYWGPQTVEAIKQYQRDNKMRVNGKWSNAMHNYIERDRKEILERRSQ